MPLPERDAVRTRQALLDAAAEAIVRHGPAVSLDAIAREAGVSKGGLLHHFRSKDALLVALVEEWLARFEAAVQRRLDPEDQRPGRLTRAHIRATFDDEAAIDNGLWGHTAVLTALLAVPEVLARSQESGRRWRRALADDGLHPDRARLIGHALDGASMTELFDGHLDPAERAETRALLLSLTEEAGPLVGSPAR
jgi:AcrR family transcriptional regulator